MKNFNKHLALPMALITVVVLMGLLIFSIDKNPPANTSSLYLFPEWNMGVVDANECYKITLENHGRIEGTVEDYVVSTMGIGLSSGIIDQSNTYKNSFNINSSSVIMFGPMGVGNINTIYVKSKSGDVYLVSVHDNRGERFNPEENNEEVQCADFIPQVENLINQLI